MSDKMSETLYTIKKTICKQDDKCIKKINNTIELLAQFGKTKPTFRGTLSKKGNPLS